MGEPISSHGASNKLAAFIFVVEQRFMVLDKKSQVPVMGELLIIAEKQ